MSNQAQKGNKILHIKIRKYTAMSFNGRTIGFGPVDGGSIPSVAIVH